MEDFKKYFEGKKVTVMGLGLLGRGVGDAKYIAEAGAAEVLVTDLKTETELKTSVDQLKDFSNVRFSLGGHKEEDFLGRDLILVAAGVPLDSPLVARAVEDGARQVQSAALFAELTKIPIIGVTGTRGKSTVAAMIRHVIETITGEQIIFGGNVRGQSNLQLLKEVKEDSVAVMELDSWQLQGWGWAEMSPQIAVFTNFMEDHLNYYQKDGMSKEEGMVAYFRDKANIFRYQEESGVLITTPEVFARAKSLPEISLGQEVVLVDDSIIPEDANLSMPGEHNRMNAALATAALKAMSLQEEEIFEALASFPGVEGRMQFVKDHNGVKIYNDNNATTPQATAVGLSGVGEGKNIVLIAGGADKNIPLDDLVSAINKHCKQVITIPGSGTDRLVSQLSDNNLETIATENLQQAFEEAQLAAESGDIILFSPAFASFSQYKNEYERNDEFISLVTEKGHENS